MGTQPTGRLLMSMLVGIFSYMLVAMDLGLERVQSFPIPDHRVVPVLVHPLSTTTVVFPEPLLGVEGIGFSSSSEQGGDYYLNVMPQRGVVSLSVWELPVPPRNLQVYMGDSLITLLVIPVEDPSASLFQLHLLKAVEATAASALSWSEAVSDRQDQQLSPVQDSRQSTPDPAWWQWGKLKFCIMKQQMNQRKGVLYVHMVVVNDGESRLFLDPQQVKVKVDEEVVEASYLSVTELTPQQRTEVEIMFPVAEDMMDESSVIEVMLGYKEEAE